MSLIKSNLFAYKFSGKNIKAPLSMYIVNLKTNLYEL